ncbi:MULTISPECIES: alginate O-acetyltransferase AlgX-related protein [unclassified Undibacterium]|uniref:alginate O-acetyltransferase AlgX-related protein n=1 Tax=unclassified Undibacterium TaxID=2630295 RepID=UPI002AC95E95|nr:MULTISPECIES: cell division protein FtsQ [unclassified Undibacterium]MEB0138407.1 cell division protein FtsQ [Undibacterium sp. CCC2.1]MEB0171282.1 cell division protein FtsQ [Undibacterium sp. CCC1.1]MEB0176480.1 cell division protein FtsQ [Undibacterium sp. CCC3.4]MEB0214036.1 cell division protein FtsQ [Undibacterium sp. 5I2]WPX43651.1 cell division protein FtsQ [Undibacterium sp. CCC3.4]
MSESFSFDHHTAGRWRYLPALAFGLILLIGLVVALTSLRAVPSKAWQEMAVLQRIADGTASRRFTSELNTHFVWSQPFAKIERAVDWNLAHDSGPSVAAGCPGWFFLSDELTVYPGGEQNAAARAYMVAQVAGLLRQRGIALLVALVPDKSRIEAAHLCGVARPARFAPRTRQWLSNLRGNGVEVLDLATPLTALAGERYYRSDSHWNEAGANAAAAAIAARLQALQLVTGQRAVLPTGAVSTIQAERPGDLMRVANLEGLPAALRPSIEISAQSKVAAVAVASDDLFGDAGLPTVAVIGTSYSLRGNFVPFLSQHLAAPVANLAKDGGDFDGAATAYLHSPALQQTPPKVIVWEVPERMLQHAFSAGELSWYARLKQGQL